MDLISGLGRSPGEGNGNRLVFLSGKSHEQKSLVGYSAWGCKRVRQNLVTKQQQKVLIFAKYVICLDENKEESEKVGLKLNIQKTKIMASGPITSWEIDRETVETVTDFIFGGSKSLPMVTLAMKLKDACSLEEKL